MSTHRSIDLICVVVTVLALILAVLFMNGERLGIEKIVDQDSEAGGTVYFTNNDLNGTWDSARATKIELRGGSAPAGWLLLLVFALVDGLAGTLLQECGVNAIGGKSASIASTIEPVTCAVLGAVFLHETVTPRSALGICLIVGATIYLFVGGRSRKEISKTS